MNCEKEEKRTEEERWTKKHAKYFQFYWMDLINGDKWEPFQHPHVNKKHTAKRQPIKYKNRLYSLHIECITIIIYVLYCGLLCKNTLDNLTWSFKLFPFPFPSFLSVSGIFFSSSSLDLTTAISTKTTTHTTKPYQTQQCNHKLFMILLTRNLKKKFTWNYGLPNQARKVASSSRRPVRIIDCEWEKTLKLWFSFTKSVWSLKCGCRFSSLQVLVIIHCIHWYKPYT